MRREVLLLLFLLVSALHARDYSSTCGAAVETCVIDKSCPSGKHGCPRHVGADCSRILMRMQAAAALTAVTQKVANAIAILPLAPRMVLV